MVMIMQVTRYPQDDVFVFPNLPDTGVRGQLAMALAWWYAGDDSDRDDEDWGTYCYAVRLIDDLVAGSTEHWDRNDWWIFWDALGQLDERPPEIEAIYRLADAQR